MKNLVRFSVERAITIFMIVIAVGIFGVVSFTRITTDLFPNVNIPFAVVVTTYPGASPEEVEQRVSVPLENAFQTTTNIQEVTSISRENISMIMLEFSAAANMDSAVFEMNENMKLIMDMLPNEAGTPTIIRLNPDMIPIMNFSVTYEGKSLSELTDWVDQELGPLIERVPGVATLSVSGGYSSEIRVMIDDELIDQVNQDIDEWFSDLVDTLNALPPAMLPEDFDMSDIEDFKMVIDKDYISGILTAQNFAFPAGFVDIEGVNYLIRVGDAIEGLDEIKDLMLLNLGIDEFPLIERLEIRLSDVADVTFAPADEQTYSKVNGVDSLTISIQKGSEFATTEVTEAINQVLDELGDDDENINITMLLDQGEYINQSTGSVVNNLIIGGVLALLVLFFFLRSLRVTFIVGVAIPISLLFAVVLIYLSGITFNLVSLSGLALGIGMLVDNGIVVIENIVRMKKEGATSKEAAIYGTHQVSGAITASTLTTVGVFLPIMFIEDFIREIFYQLALTVTFSLLASLFIALSLVPSLAAKVLTEESAQVSMRPTLLDKTKAIYERILKVFFKARGLVLAGALVLFIASIILATSRGFEFFPDSDEGTLSISISIDSDAPITFEQFTDTLDDLYGELENYDDIETIGISLGGGMFMLGAPSSQRANVNVVLREDRRMSTLEMRDEIITVLEENFDHVLFEVAGTQGDLSMLVGSGIQIRLQGLDMQVLREEALNIADLINSIEGYREIDPGFGRETNEIKITVDKDKAIEYGMTVGQVLGMIATYLAPPQSVGQVRIESYDYQIYIYESDDEKQRTVESLDEIKNLEIEGLLGTVTLDEIAEIIIQPGFSSITRINGARTLNISADIETGYNATLLATELEEALDSYVLPSGYDYEIMGESEEIMAAIDTLILVGVLAIAIVYMIMASQFQSLVYPFIIMMTIPLAFTGGFLILFISGSPVSIIAIVGLIILSGVVVNNGIVLVDYINQLRAKGMELKEAIFEAGKVRMRPIFMTALTTILALSAMAIGFGQGSELIQPMALTAIGGLIYATFLTIFIVPILYYSITRNSRIVFGSVFTGVFLIAAIYLFIRSNIWLGSFSIIIALGVLLFSLIYPRWLMKKEEV